MKHVLVVGGSGMLKKTVVWLAGQGWPVTVMGRTRHKMEQLLKMKGAGALISPVYIDYTEKEAFQGKIRQLMMRDRTDLVVAWIHSTAPGALETIIRERSRYPGNWQLVHVLGSRTDPSALSRQIRVPASCHYCQVQLGFVIEQNRSRWLTHDEISGGVIKAIRAEQLFCTIGVVEPREMRP